MSSPCHIELILSEKEEPVKKEVIENSLSIIESWNVEENQVQGIIKILFEWFYFSVFQLKRIKCYDMII